ncbi:hypothetical protein GQ44DRAFT_727785 [Phaeosphaeriaceae sp. PMI808]|nr:hypothetical protein GQ44DRAFT_727785 [Phaeosphaeriaceae sp. PMI808]
MLAPTEIPTVDSLRASRTPVFTFMDMLRVRWKPFSPIQSSVYVTDDLSTISSSLSSYQKAAVNDASFHQISTSLATESPVSSITESDWVDEHEPHAQHDSGQAQWSTEPSRKLMRCCGQDRPHPPPPLLVRSTVQQFVTMHDFVTQTHAWLQPLQEDILNAMEATFGSSFLNTQLYVALIALDKSMIVSDGNCGQADRHWERVADHARKRVEGTLGR